MNNLVGQVGVMKTTITIKRKATGKVETYELTSEPVTPEQAATIIGNQQKEQDHGSNA